MDAQQWLRDRGIEKLQIVQTRKRRGDLVLGNALRPVEIVRKGRSS